MSDDLTALAAARDEWIILETERVRAERFDPLVDDVQSPQQQRAWDNALREIATSRWTTMQRTIPAKVRREVLASDLCAYCEDYAQEVDHIIPVAAGGTADRANLAPACCRCNAEKRDRTLDEWKAWREASGRRWPPRSLMVEASEIAKRMMQEAADRDGLTLDEWAERMERDGKAKEWIEARAGRVYRAARAA